MTTLISDVSDLVQTFWAPMFVPEMMEMAVLPSLVNRDYEGVLSGLGDTVKVSQILRPTATRKTKGQNHQVFESEQLQTGQVDIVADQVITAAFEFDSLVQLQSQLGDKDSEIRRALEESLLIELNNYVYSKVNPSSASPDHVINSVSDFNGTQLGVAKVLAGQSKWPKSKGWWMLLDPQYHVDLLGVAALTSKDYAPDAPVVGGQFAVQRFGFNILEDNSEGMSQLSPTNATVDLGLAFHPDFMHLVVQQAPKIEISSLHSQKKHGFLISASIVCGAALGNQGALKHIKFYNS